MDSRIFEERYANADTKFDVKDLDEQIKRSISWDVMHGDIANTHLRILAMEELAELQQAIAKNLRYESGLTNVIEEMADVIVMLEYLRMIYNITGEDLARALNVKKDRMKNNLDNLYNRRGDKNG